MRYLPILLALAGPIALRAQTTPAPLPGNPEAMLHAAASSYDLQSAAAKPWHLRILYQLYDQDEKPSETGTLEYWWASPERNRESLTRGNVTWSRWHTPEGKTLGVASGRFNFAENGLLNQFLSPLPSPDRFNDENTRFQKETVKFGNTDAPCVMLVPKGLAFDSESPAAGLFPTYCFDPKFPLLVARLAWGAPTIGYGSFLRFAGHYLAGSVTEYERGRRILTAKLDSAEGMQPDDAALIPPPDATENPFIQKVGVASGVMAGARIGGSQPAYPENAKAARESGTVVLRALIGTDGRIHDLSVVSAPALSLVIAAMQSVQTWQYRPYLLNGQPVEVETQINVVFTLG
ncbi:MAG TPA: energy transducer TonB [Acidobacteriaceae bacterium]